MGIASYFSPLLFFLLIPFGLLLSKDDFDQIEEVLEDNLQVAFLSRGDLKVPSYSSRYQENNKNLFEMRRDPIHYMNWIKKTEEGYASANPPTLVSELYSLMGGHALNARNYGSVSPLPKFSPQDRQSISDLLLEIPAALKEDFGRLLVAMEKVRQLYKKIQWTEACERAIQQLMGQLKDPRQVVDEANLTAYLSGPAKNWREILRANCLVAHHAYLLSRSLKQYEFHNASQAKRIFSTPFGDVVLGGPGDDIYERSFALIIDFGGDDKYLGPAAATRPGFPLSLLFDVSGDDLYRYEGAAQASGVLGCAFLWDQWGDDRYEAGSLSQGAGVLGLGVLIDEAGRDTYRALNQSQAFSAWGLGLLVDGRGSDIYRGQVNCQSVSRTRGVSLLQDREGDDFYILEGKPSFHQNLESDQTALGQGASAGYEQIRLAGGVAILHDVAGDDYYLSEIASQGVGIAGGMGHLWDRQGNDHYSCHQGGIGSASREGAGAVFDLKGDDLYHLRSQVGLAGSQDFSLALVMDLQGNDRYQGSSISLGKSKSYSVALLIDVSGRDSYTANEIKSNELNHLDGSLGIQLDLGQEDDYSILGGDDEVHVSGNLFLNIDLKSFSYQ